MNTPNRPSNASAASTVFPAHIMDRLDTPAWFADKERILRYVNVAGRSHKDIVGALGKDIVDCHGPESGKEVKALYESWAAGNRQPQVYLRTKGKASKYNILIPVHGPDGFEGVVELSFTTGEA